jgi:hypothetical protein
MNMSLGHTICYIIPTVIMPIVDLNEVIGVDYTRLSSGTTGIMLLFCALVAHRNKSPVWFRV